MVNDRSSGTIKVDGAKRKTGTPWILAGCMTLVLLTLPSPSVTAAELSNTLEIGYMSDLGGAFNFKLGELSSSHPFFISAGFGFIYQFDSGEAQVARSAFVSDSPIGIVNEHGESYRFALNVGYSFHNPTGNLVLDVYLGVRHDRYEAFFTFDGSNEAFGVTSNPFGLGLGAQWKVRVSQKHNDYLFVNTGVEYYFKAQLRSPGSYNYYHPDNTNDNPRTNGSGYTYTYEDVDEAVRQPRLRPVLTLGYQYRIR